MHFIIIGLSIIVLLVLAVAASIYARQRRNYWRVAATLIILGVAAFIGSSFTTSEILPNGILYAAYFLLTPIGYLSVLLGTICAITLYVIRNK